MARIYVGFVERALVKDGCKCHVTDNGANFFLNTGKRIGVSKSTNYVSYPQNCH